MSTRVVTGPCRSTHMYVNRLENRSDKPDAPKTCKSGVLIPKKDKKTISAIRKAIDAASKAKFGKVIVREGRDGYPLRDIDDERKHGDLPDSLGDAPDNHYFLNSKSYKIPGLVDRDGMKIEDPEEREELCVSGYHYNFSLNFKGFDQEGNRGVRVELCNMRFLKEDERFDGGVKAEDEDWGDAEDDQIDFDDDDEPRSRRRVSRDDDYDDEDDDDEPRSRRSARKRAQDYDDELEDKRSRRRSRRSRDDDDEEEQPRRRIRRRA